MLLENYLSGHDIAEVRESEVGYNYYGFTSPTGTWRILREKTDGTEYRMAIGYGDFDAAFIARATQNYRKTNQLPRL